MPIDRNDFVSSSRRIGDCGIQDASNKIRLRFPYYSLLELVNGIKSSNRCNDILLNIRYISCTNIFYSSRRGERLQFVFKVERKSHGSTSSHIAFCELIKLYTRSHTKRCSNIAWHDDDECVYTCTCKITSIHPYTYIHAYLEISYSITL